MPALEMAQESGKLVSWLKQEGEQVRKGEMLLEVETDKAVVEVEAQADGVLAGITAKVGDVVPVGRTIAWLVAPGEAVPVGEAVSSQSGRTMATPAPESRAAPAEGAGQAVARQGRVSPKARKVAQEHGVDLSKVSGSGPGGEISAEDVLKVAQSRAQPAASQAPVGPLSAAPASGEPLRATSASRIMAERTTESWTTVPHFFLIRDVDATALNAAREKAVPVVQQSHGVKPTHTDLIVAAVARALTRHPRMNGSWSNGRVQANREINVAVAMAVENAVVTGVIRNADRTSLGDIATRRKELGERARANKLQPADIAGATFTISNLGMFGIDAFTAIIVPPQAGILAVGAITDRVVAVNGEAGMQTIAVRPIVTLTLSSDHRVIDGAGAAAFLGDVVSELTALTS
jgi:pyruvate dehydrogenase E2 component (dihydrolipoamide acetyltransferase)